MVSSVFLFRNSFYLSFSLTRGHLFPTSLNFGRLMGDVNNYLKRGVFAVFFLLSVVMSLGCAGGSISIREKVCNRNLNVSQFVTNELKKLLDYI